MSECARCSECKKLKIYYTCKNCRFYACKGIKNNCSDCKYEGVQANRKTCEQCNKVVCKGNCNQE